MSKIIVKNGHVYDPINNINGEVKDILIENGIIVEKFSSENQVKEINAQDKTIIPAGIDIHCHIATPQLNWVRLLGVNYEKFKSYWNNLTLNAIAQNYIKMGYTFVTEANVFPSLANQTVFNLKNLPVLDKAFLLNTSNLWMLDLEYQRHKTEDIAIFLSDLLKKTNAFGIKVYNPFENEDWNLKSLRKGISSQGRLYNFSPLDVYISLTKAVEHLNLPHSLHAHIEGYETDVAKNNLAEITEKVKELPSRIVDSEETLTSRQQLLHIAHASTLNRDGDTTAQLNLINSDERFDLDLGFIGFDDINPIITSDRHLIQQEHRSNNLLSPLVTSAIESEGDFFASIRVFSKSNKTHCVYWANAIELAIKAKNKWQVQLSLNFPNYGNITNVAKIGSWLMSSEARNKYMEDMSDEFKSSTTLQNLENNLTFNDFVVISRASPAKSLGIGKIKGNLGPNADGDLNVLDINVNDIDFEKEYDKVVRALSALEYVLKSGQVVKNKNHTDSSLSGKIYVSQEIKDIDISNLSLSRKVSYFEKYNSLFYDNYKVPLNSEHLRVI